MNREIPECLDFPQVEEYQEVQKHISNAMITAFDALESAAGKVHKLGWPPCPSEALGLRRPPGLGWVLLSESFKTLQQALETFSRHFSSVFDFQCFLPRCQNHCRFSRQPLHSSPPQNCTTSRSCAHPGRCECHRERAGKGPTSCLRTMRGSRTIHHTGG